MIKRFLVFVHRWLGVAFCLVFLLWFPSGIGMMYWGYPDVSADDRLERGPALDRAKILLSPSEAYARLDPSAPPASQARLNMFDGRPVYRFRAAGSGVTVFADTGEERGDVSMEMVARIAAAWTKQVASAARVEKVTEVDQWTLQTNLGTVQPLWKYTWPNGEQVYVSQASGEVVQYTTTASRIGAYLGPIPHWFYFTPLRKHGPEWSRVVIWTSGIGTIAAIIGVVIGVWMYSPSRKYRYAGTPTSIPYRGQKRWHTVFGLIFGVAAVTYAFSGMLSMDPFPSFNDRVQQRRGGGEPNVRMALHGDLDPAAFDAKHPRQALEQLGQLQVKEIDLMSFDGEAIYLGRLADGDTRVIPMRGDPRTGFDQKEIVRVVSAAADGRMTTRLLDQYDRYYLDRTRRLPLPVILAEATTGQQTRYYIDPRTARIVQTYNSSNWVNRWLYNGLHSLNFPWLYNYRPLWDIVVITLMLGGTALCVTSLILAWRVLGRKLARVLNVKSTREPTLSEDLA